MNDTAFCIFAIAALVVVAVAGSRVADEVTARASRPTTACAQVAK